MDRDVSYSPDVEIDEQGRLVAARDLIEGETICVPLHMFNKAMRDVPTSRAQVESERAPPAVREWQIRWGAPHPAPKRWGQE